MKERQRLMLVCATRNGQFDSIDFPKLEANTVEICLAENNLTSLSHPPKANQTEGVAMILVSL